MPKAYPPPYIPKTKTEKTLDLISKRGQAETVCELGNKAGLHLASISRLGERDATLLVDDTYEMKVIDQSTKEIIHNFKITSTQVKCIQVAESKIFFGLSFGAIWMFDAYSPFEKIGQVALYDNAAPSSMCIESQGKLIVGLANGSIEQFKFDQEGIKSVYPVGNKIKVPQAGEIYDMTVVELPEKAGLNPTIVLATFSGLIFGRISNLMIDGAFGRQYCWETEVVFMKDKMISQIC